MYEPGPYSWNQSWNYARSKGGAIGSISQIQYITARRVGKASYVESDFKKMPLIDTGAWGIQNDKKDLWIAVGPDERLKDYVQIGDF